MRVPRIRGVIIRTAEAKGCSREVTIRGGHGPKEGTDVCHSLVSLRE